MNYSKFARIRKAVAAGIAVLGTIPVVGIISGDIQFDFVTVVSTIVAAIGSAYVVWRTPNVQP